MTVTRKAIEESARASYVDDRPERRSKQRPAEDPFGDLDWFFNWAAGDLGTPSGVEVLAAICNGSVGTGPSDAEGRRADRVADSAKRFQLIADVIHRMTKREQSDLGGAFIARKWPHWIGHRPVHHRHLALRSAPVRDRLRLVHQAWSETVALALLERAEGKHEKEHQGEWTALRVATWKAAEDRFDALLIAFADLAAERDHEKAVAKARRIRKLEGAA